MTAQPYPMHSVEVGPSTLPVVILSIDIGLTTRHPISMAKYAPSAGTFFMHQRDTCASLSPVLKQDIARNPAVVLTA